MIILYFMKLLTFQHHNLLLQRSLSTRKKVLKIFNLTFDIQAKFERNIMSKLLNIQTLDHIDKKEKIWHTPRAHLYNFYKCINISNPPFPQKSQSSSCFYRRLQSLFQAKTVLSHPQDRQTLDTTNHRQTNTRHNKPQK